MDPRPPRGTRVSRANTSTTSVEAASSTPPDSANLDLDAGRADDGVDSSTRKVPRARHEIVTGPDDGDKIAPGTRITRKVIEEHGLESDQLEKLLKAGAIELIDVEVDAD